MNASVEEISTRKIRETCKRDRERVAKKGVKNGKRAKNNRKRARAQLLEEALCS